MAKSTMTKWGRTSTEDNANEDEHVVKKIVGHTVENGRVMYPVRWYGYTSNDDTDKPEEDIVNHFICR